MRKIVALTIIMTCTAPALADDTVRCNLDAASFYTTHPVCNAMIEEYSAMLNASTSVPKLQAVHHCADNLSKKLPGQNRPAYLNQCDAMASMIPRYRF